MRIRGERWRVLDGTVYGDARVLTVQGCERTNQGVRARFLLPFERWERVTGIQTTRVVTRRRWRRLAAALLAEALPAPDSLHTAAAADITILSYQLEPALAVNRGVACRLLLADEVGLGKTIQAGLVVAETLARRGDAHVLVLCPAGLRQQWAGELRHRFRLDPVAADSTWVQRAPPIDSANPWAVHPLILASIDYVKRPEVLKSLEPLVWDLLVVDEAHGTGGSSERHAAVRLLAQRARVVVLLTATPHSGDDAAFSRLTATGDLDDAFPLVVFRRTRADVREGTTRRTHWLRARPTATEHAMHAALATYARRVWRGAASPAARLAMIVLTRRACSSASSLVRSLERRLALLSGAPEAAQLPLPLADVPPGDDEPGAELGAPGLHDAADERRSVEAVLACARHASLAESKLRVLARLLARTAEPAIVFTEYRDTLAALERALSDVSTCQLHGGLTAAERAEALDLFASGRRRVLLATDAASEGLNLQWRCRLVIHLEVPWTPLRIEQRVGRVDRIGQAKVVHQIHLLAGSAEETRVAAVMARWARAANVLSAASTLDERQTAAHIIGGDPIPGRPREDALPRGLMTVNLRTAADMEAARLHTVRALLTGVNAGDSLRHGSPVGAPFVARSSRRNRQRGVSAFWLECSDAADQLIWALILGCDGDGFRAGDASPGAVRSAAALCWASAHASIERDRHRLTEAVVTALRAPLVAAVAREQAIGRCAAARHARMAADLLQARLFDRRDERAASAQRELLDRVLARCQTSAAALARVEGHTFITFRPAFALVAW